MSVAISCRPTRALRQEGVPRANACCMAAGELANGAGAIVRCPSIENVVDGGCGGCALTKVEGHGWMDEGLPAVDHIPPVPTSCSLRRTLTGSVLFSLLTRSQQAGSELEQGST